MAATLQTFHSVDILINNAGIVRAADFLDMTEADFDEVIRVNLKGMFLVRPLCTHGQHQAKLHTLQVCRQRQVCMQEGVACVPEVVHAE